MPAVLPIVDLSRPEEDAAAVMRQACTEHGFFYVANSGVDEALVEACFEAQRRFFALPMETKMLIKADANNRGFTPLAEETLDPDGSSQGDSHSGLYYCRDVPADSEEARLPLHGPNQWLPEELLPGYRAVTDAYLQSLCGLGARILHVLSLSLRLPADYFDAHFSKPMVALRPLHYTAARSKPEEGLFGAGAHTDYGLLTLLRTDGTPGLQLRTKAGEWMDVPQLPGHFIVNIGDLLQRWSNGLYVSTLHRVLNVSGTERYSLPFFYEPNFDTLVEPLPPCVEDTGGKPLHPPVCSGEWLLSRYAATHSGYAVQDKVAVTA